MPTNNYDEQHLAFFHKLEYSKCGNTSTMVDACKKAISHWESVAAVPHVVSTEVFTKNNGLKKGLG